MNEWAGIVDRQRLDELEPSARRELLRHMLSDRRPPENRRVFANRTLRMGKIRTVGFDLDWTLADYARDQLAELAFELTLDRMVERGYPEAILEAEFRPEFCRRGLILDSEAGTVLKMDRHRYVGRAYQGRDFLDGGERARLYRQEPINPSHKRYYFVDTLFELPEVNIFSELIHMTRQRPPTLELPSFVQLFQDARSAIDSIHADGSLKRATLADLGRYLPRDPLLPLALKRMALGGRRLLLITNSEWFYTDGLCQHLFDGAIPGLRHWRELFDLVIVDAGKPAFFRKGREFVELDDGGEALRAVEKPSWNRVYSGGNREGLMELLGGPGESVLYVGDHIYGDVVSSKLSSTWRTALVVRELEDELAVRQSLSMQLRHVAVLRAELADSGQRMDDLDDVLALYRSLAPAMNGHGDGAGDASLHKIRDRLHELRDEHRAMRQHVRRLQDRVSAAVNPCWGSLFKQGSNKSLFGSQVDDYACVYTSRVSNFAFYGSSHYFRVMADSMMHEASI
jgi:HAD superfamily 5'-nucleotidase-like hydrolase